MKSINPSCRNDKNIENVQKWLKSQLNRCRQKWRLPPLYRYVTSNSIYFEHSNLINVIGQLNAAPSQKKGQSGSGLSPELRAYYIANGDEAWALANENRNQQIHHQIVTNSVLISILFREPKQEDGQPNSHIEKVRRKFMNEEYTYRSIPEWRRTSPAFGSIQWLHKGKQNNWLNNFYH